MSFTQQRHQRAVLLKMARAYRTVSTEALQVITGRIPIDLLVREKRKEYEILNRRERQPIGNRHHSNMTDKATVKETLREETMNNWNRRWTTTQKGRHTYAYFPDVIDREKMNWINLDHYNTQILTGHGSFGDYLKRFKIK